MTKNKINSHSITEMTDVTLACLGIVLIIIVLSAVYQKIKHRDCVSKKRLDGKTVLVTGGTAGMGLEVAKELARRGARVIIACPFPEEGRRAREHIIQASSNHDVHFRMLQLASLADTRRFAEDILKHEPRLDILINNAGVGGPSDRITSDGFNFIMQVNYFGAVLLTLLLLPLLRKSGRPEPSRIINIASALHWIGNVDIDRLKGNNYSIIASEAYPNSKLCLVMFTRELARRLKGDVVVNSVEPGTVGTGIYDTWSSYGFLLRWFILLVCKSPRQGAQTTLHVALDEAEGVISGEYFEECGLSKAGKRACDEDLSARLWEESLRLVKLSSEELEGILD